MINRILAKFKGNKRTEKAKKNIIGSLLIKGGSIIIGFLMFRIVLDYLDQVKYGIWLTMTSFLTWFSFFEIGLGNGLRNKLAESLANKDIKMARTYVSTTYAILAIVISVVALVFFISNMFVDWTVLMNTDKSLLLELRSLSFIVFGLFFLTFVLKLIGTILHSDQRSATANLLNPLGNLIALISIYLLVLNSDKGSLIYLGIILSVSPVLILLIASIYFFNNDYSHIAPSVKYVNFKYSKDLFSLGVKFFIINISALIMFQSSNFIIAQFFGPSEVTSYNIAYKLFSVITMLFTIIISPFWSAFTEAWVKEDIQWVKKTIRSLFYVWVAIFIVAVILFFISDTFFNLWLTKEKMKTIVITNILKISLLSYFLLFAFGGIFNMFINGVGKISVQMYSLMIGAILFYPLSMFFIKYLNWGVESVVIASIIANFYSPFIAPYQYLKIINKRANGIWNK